MSQAIDILPNALIGRTEKPADEDLAAALGRSAKALWDGLVAQLATELDVATQEWHSYSVKAGWALRLQRKKRNIVYLSPCHGCFRVSFILGDKAVQAARGSGLPAGVLATIDGAPRYAEGTGVRLEVHARKDVAVVLKLAQIKLEN